MKKFFALMLVSILALSAMAQSPVYRVGDKYMMDGKMMNKREFKGYLQNTSPEAFQLFNNGYKLGVAGWACFGTGLAINTAGSAMLRSFLRGETQKGIIFDIGTSLTSLGSGLTIAGIVCVSVGYTRMHKAVNLYNIEKAHRPDLRWVFGVNGNGDMSIAMQF